MAKTGLKALSWLFTILSAIGGLAWGAYGISRFAGGEFHLVDWIFRLDWLSNIIYILVGISGLLLVPTVLAMLWKKIR